MNNATKYDNEPKCKKVSLMIMINASEVVFKMC